MPSRFENSFSDHVILNLLRKEKLIKYKHYFWLDRGSDERQYCSLVELPIASLMRSKFMEYPEYHTSEDRLDRVVTSKGLSDSFSMYKKLIMLIEKNYFIKSSFKCEPFLSKRSLYPSSIKNLKITEI